MGNVFVRDNTEIFLGGDRRPMDGSSSMEDEVEDAPHQMWNQLLAANMLPPDVVASGIIVTDDVLRAIYPSLTCMTISPPAPSEEVHAVFNSDTGRPSPWETALARDVAEMNSTPPINEWSVPYAGGDPPPASRPVSVLVATRGSSDVMSAPPMPPASRRSRPRRRDSEFASQFPRSPGNPNGRGPKSGNQPASGGLQGGARNTRSGAYRQGDAEPSFTDHPLRRSPSPPPPPLSGSINQSARGLTATVSSSSVRFAKLRSTFKPPTLDGNATTANWKVFEEGFDRYAIIHGLGEVMSPDYDVSDPANFDANQIFYYALQEAVSGSPLGHRHFKSAQKWDGHGACNAVHAAFNFVGPTTAALLMKQLTEFRISPAETHSAFIFRLVALFDDLECVPGDSAYEFKDVQKTGYLLSAIAHEPDLRQMHLHIQTSLSRGSITFDQACMDLQIQCDDARAHEILTNGGSASRPRRSRALISTKGKGLNTNDSSIQKDTLCMVDSCKEKRHRGLCRLHFTQLGSGKAQELKLRNNWGVVTWDSATNFVVYPSAVPANRRPGGGHTSA